MNSTLTFLGTDSGFGKKNNSSYFENGNELVLIDCGFTVFHEVKEKFDLKKYDLIEIVIAHLHNDHAGSLSQLILYLWFVLQIDGAHIKIDNIVDVLKDLKQMGIDIYLMHMDDKEYIKNMTNNEFYYS